MVFIISALIINGFTFTVYAGVCIGDNRHLALRQADNFYLGKIEVGTAQCAVPTAGFRIE